MSQYDLDSSDGIQVVKDAISSAIETTLTATTTAQIAKVGGSNLASRKYVFIQAKDSNVKWGFSSSCLFDAFKDQAIWIPVIDAQDIYIKRTSGTASVIVAEGA